MPEVPNRYRASYSLGGVTHWTNAKGTDMEDALKRLRKEVGHSASALCVWNPDHVRPLP